MSLFDEKYPTIPVTESATMFRRGAKINILQMIILINAFASGLSITKTADKASVHRDTVKDIFTALRERLAKPRFQKWVQSEYANPHLSATDDVAQMSEAREALFLCHENTECQKRYFAGRRESRVCRSCPVKAYGDRHGAQAEYAPLLVDIADDVRDVYRDLGWKESANSGETPREIFDKRFRHYEILSTALAKSTFDETGNCTSTEDDFLSLRHLSEELVNELIEEPLR